VKIIDTNDMINLIRVVRAIAKKTLTRFSWLRKPSEGYYRLDKSLRLVKSCMTFAGLALLFLFLSIHVAYSQNFWQETNGPYCGNIQTLAFIEYHNNMADEQAIASVIDEDDY
jgi:hypothetical protein